eukprot:PhM_4_TR5336/c0_g1_i1/m.77802
MSKPIIFITILVIFVAYSSSEEVIASKNHSKQSNNTTHSSPSSNHTKPTPKQSTTAKKSSTLKGVYILHRHGARSPRQLDQTDGTTMLSTNTTLLLEGVAQMQQLASFVKERYGESFVTSGTHSSHSSTSPRCVQSARAFWSALLEGTNQRTPTIQGDEDRTVEFAFRYDVWPSVVVHREAAVTKGTPPATTIGHFMKTDIGSRHEELLHDNRTMMKLAQEAGCTDKLGIAFVDPLHCLLIAQDTLSVMRALGHCSNDTLMCRRDIADLLDDTMAYYSHYTYAFPQPREFRVESTGLFGSLMLSKIYEDANEKLATGKKNFISEFSMMETTLLGVYAALGTMKEDDASSSANSHNLPVFGEALFLEVYDDHKIAFYSATPSAKKEHNYAYNSTFRSLEGVGCVKTVAMSHKILKPKRVLVRAPWSESVGVDAIPSLRCRIKGLTSYLKHHAAPVKGTRATAQDTGLESLPCRALPADLKAIDCDGTSESKDSPKKDSACAFFRTHCATFACQNDKLALEEKTLKCVDRNQAAASNEKQNSGKSSSIVENLKDPAVLKIMLDVLAAVVAGSIVYFLWRRHRASRARAPLSSQETRQGTYATF